MRKRIRRLIWNYLRRAFHYERCEDVDKVLLRAYNERRIDSYLLHELDDALKYGSPYPLEAGTKRPWLQRLLRLRARGAWLWRIGLIRRTTAFRWEMDAGLGQLS